MPPVLWQSAPGCVTVAACRWAFRGRGPLRAAVVPSLSAAMERERRRGSMLWMVGEALSEARRFVDQVEWICGLCRRIFTAGGGRADASGSCVCSAFFGGVR